MIYMSSITKQKIKVILYFITMQCFTFTLFLTTIGIVKGEINIYTILLFLVGVFGGVVLMVVGNAIASIL